MSEGFVQYLLRIFKFTGVVISVFQILKDLNLMEKPHM